MTGQRYSSVIPKPPRGTNAYAIYSKKCFPSISAAHRELEHTEVMKIVAEKWRQMSKEEQQPFVDSAAKSKHIAMREWETRAAEREKKRKTWCEKLKLPLYASWETIDEANKKLFVQAYGNDSKRKRKTSDDDDSDSSDEEGDASRSGVGIARDKATRAATVSAMKKLKDSDSDSNSGSDYDDEIERRRKLREKQAQQKLSTGVRSSNILSGNMCLLQSNSSLASAKSTSSTLKKRSSRKGDKEWETALWSDVRLPAVIKAIDRVYDMSLNQENFDLFGNDMIQCFYDVGTVTGEPVRSKTLKYVEHLANRWKHTVMQRGWKEAENGLPTPYEVIDAVIGMYCMERVGIRHDVKAEILEFMNSGDAYTPKDYLGWDPFAGPPADRTIEVSSGLPVSKYRAFSNAIIHAFFADRVGIDLGCSFVQIFQWLPALRPYKGPHELSWQEYIDQCYLVTHIIFVMNNWGELALSASLFPHEFFFLRSNIDIHLQQRDVHLIAEFVESLRCFGCVDTDPLIQKGMSSLLSLQCDSGIWDDTDGEDPYRTYHATMCGAQALLAHRYRGFGPGIADVLPILSSWVQADVAEKDNIISLTTQQADVSLSLRRMAQREIEREAKEAKEVLSYRDFDIDSLGGSVTKQSVDYSSSRIAFAKSISETMSLISAATLNIQAILTQLGKALSTFNKSDGAMFEENEIHLIDELLTCAKDLPVTIQALQANSKVAKMIKNISKRKEMPKFSSKVSGKVDTLVSTAASVVLVWKDKILTAPSADSVAETAQQSNDVTFSNVGNNSGLQDVVVASTDDS